ncbi:MAG: hypothetical protein HC919_15850 [Oscillatoriales cyanobacterium SM2_2_1]|nr:hypothetical protein [Oscillatoriales cyanobacterium SM2_2_1]
MLCPCARDNLLLSDRGSLTAESATGQGGDIDLSARNIQLRRQSFISAAGSAIDPTLDGNIRINAETLVLLEASRIVTRAADPQGGSNINIAPFGNSDLVVLESPDSLINAVGEVTIEGDIEPEPPEAPEVATIDAESELDRNPCNFIEGSEFINTGRGGIPPMPSDPLRGDITMVEWVEMPGEGGGGECS